MSECSLGFINDAACHNKIKDGGCPGFIRDCCVNDKALAALAAKNKRDDRARVCEATNMPGSGHLVYQRDPKSVEVTQRHIGLFIRGVKKARHCNAPCI